ncbi:MAG: hypothetical protein LBC92_04055 [Rickettsiales bacterium]|jgi:hypothetical protein|nr:hypothetical protein [Rickettsiales bacterium]
MEITKITKDIFFKLEKSLIEQGKDSDNRSFKEIKELLNNPPILGASEFAGEIIYAILTSGFKQKTAKKIHEKIMFYVNNTKDEIKIDDLLNIFRHQGKIESICKIWNNKRSLQKEYYGLKTQEDRLIFLEKISYIGCITKYHHARNLGENCYKPDIHIQRLATVLCDGDVNKINNAKLNKEVKILCDKMFCELEKEIGEKIGYIDVVLWKSCSENLLIPDLDRKKIILKI